MVNENDVLLKVLRKFANRYFRKSVPIIKWKYMKDADGSADIKHNTIYLNPTISLDRSQCRVGLGNLIHTNPIALHEGEQYFYVLLHEIGHFKVKWKTPRYFLKVKKQLEKAYPDNIRSQLDLADYFIQMRKNEDKGRYYLRVEDFQAWLAGGDIPSEHTEVEMWAKKQFKKAGKIIRSINPVPVHA